MQSSGMECPYLWLCLRSSRPALTIPAPAEGAKPKPSMYKFFADLAAGGVAGAVSKTAVAPIERVKLILQTQDSNPRIKSGEIARYTGIGNCFTRVSAEQGALTVTLCCARC